MKRNLLELCLSPDLGGLELYMMRCARALEEDFNVISVLHPKGKLLSYFENSGYAYETLEKKSNLLMFGAARKLARLIDAEAIDIVHFHWTKDMPLAVLAKKLSKRKPKLVQTRNMLMTRFKDDFYHRALYNNLDLMLPTSDEVKEQIETFVPASVRPRVERLYMGVGEPEPLDAEAVRSLREELGMNGSFAVGLVGRIEEAKGQHLLIEAVESLVGKGLDVQAFFVGHAMKESYLGELRSQVHAKGLDARVHFLGFMKNPHHFMQACDAIVLATEHETFGLVLVEAMQMRTAVIGSNRGGVLEIIEDRKSGLHFESLDAKSLAESIEFLYNDRERAAQIAKNGKERAKAMFLDTTQSAKLAQLLNSL
jgi:glycosyltransferase involved in cell wall biosynthesis